MEAFPLGLACIIMTNFMGIHQVKCQVYSWTNQPGDIYNQPCNSDQLNFSWNFTPATPDPALIEWSKQNVGGTFDAVAIYVGGTLTEAPSYAGRVVRTGSTAELGLMNPTSADDGTYRVSVTDNLGNTITSQNVVVSTVTTSTLDTDGITATCGSDGKTVTCAGVVSVGIPGALLTLSYGSSSVDNGGTQITVSQEMTSQQTVMCSISGLATECLAAGMMISASVECGPSPTIVLGATSAQFNSNPAASELNGAATLSWQIPAGGLGNGSTFYAISPAGSAAFFLIPPSTVIAAGDYTGRVEFTGSYTSRNITFTLRNISSTDAGTYGCGRGGVTDVISDCGQMLVVLGKPTKPARPSPNTTPVYNQQVTLTCTSTSTSLPQGHGLTLTYTWERDGTVVTPDPETSFTFTVTSRDPHNYRCRADESRGLESDWSDVYTMEPEYGPYQESLTPPGLSYTVRENQTPVPPISCSANCKPACTFRWERNGTTFSNSYVLNLGQSSRSHTGSYRCQPSNNHGNIYTSSVSVDVQYPPEVHITTPAGCRPYRVYFGQQNVQLFCEVTASNPEVTSFTWRHKNSVVSSASGQILTINTISESSAGSYSCQGNNGIPGSSVSQSHTLDVQYAPRVSIPAVSPVVEGSNLTVRCTVDANPTAFVSWTKKTDSSFTRPGPVLEFTGIQRDKAGEYVCSATNTISPCGQTDFSGSGQEEVTVDVLYKASINKFSLNSATGPVTVSEGETVTLKCQVDSNPPATIRLLNGSQELERGDNSLNETSTWQTTCRQRGDYSCRASNSVGPVAVSDLKLAVECSPRPDETFPVKHQSASTVGGSVTLWMSVLSYPAPTYTWSRSNSSSLDLSGSLSVLSDISINISLTLTSLSREDFGLYKLTVRNGIWEDHVTTFELVPQGPSNWPNNVHVREITPSSAVVSWTRGFNGGDKQHFIVSYSMDNTTWMNSSKIEEKEKTDDYDITLSDLKAATSYIVRVIAENKFGDSGYTEAVLLETKADPIVPQANNQGLGIALGITIPVIVVLVVVVVVMYRKRNMTGKSSSTNRNQTVYEDVEPAAPVDRSTYDSLDNTTPAQVYADLKLYENTKHGANLHGDQSTTNQSKAHEEDLSLHTYANTKHASDHGYANTNFS